MVIGEKARRLGKVAAMAGFGFVVFLVVLYVTLPYARFKDYIAAQVSSYGYDMEAKHAGPALGIGMSLKEVSLVSRSSGTGKPTRILIDRVRLGVSLLSYLTGSKSFSLSARVFGGDIDADVRIGKSDTSVESSVSEIDLAELPWVKSLINLPMAGKFDVNLNLALPKQRLSESKGLLRWECTACALGDGKAKLTIASNPLLAEGLGLPKIRLGDFTGKIPIDKGVGRLQNVQFKSPDLEATVEGEIHLAQPVAASRVDLYVRFKLSDALLRSSEKLRTIMDFTAQMGKRPDGFIGFRMSGSFQNMSSVQWLKTSPFVNTATPSKPVPHPVAAALPPPIPLPSVPPPPPVPPHEVVHPPTPPAPPPPPPVAPVLTLPEPPPAPPPPPAAPAPAPVPSPPPAAAPVPSAATPGTTLPPPTPGVRPAPATSPTPPPPPVAPAATAPPVPPPPAPPGAPAPGEYPR